MSGVPSETKETPKKSHKKRNALVTLIVIVFALAIAASVSRPTTSPTISTTSTTPQEVVPALCVFRTNNSFTLSTPVVKNFQDCLMKGSTHIYEFAATGFGVSWLNGTVDSEFPVSVQVWEGGISGGMLYSQTNTTSVRFSNIPILSSIGYTVRIANLGQNNSLSVSLQFS